MIYVMVNTLTDMDEEKMYKDAEQRICNACSSHKDCPWVIRGLESKCPYLGDVMYGYEVCQEDMKKDAIDSVVQTNSLSGNTIVVHLDWQYKHGQMVKVIVIH